VSGRTKSTGIRNELIPSSNQYKSSGNLYQLTILQYFRNTGILRTDFLSENNRNHPLAAQPLESRLPAGAQETFHLTGNHPIVSQIASWTQRSDPGRGCWWLVAKMRFDPGPCPSCQTEPRDLIYQKGKPPFHITSQDFHHHRQNGTISEGNGQRVPKKKRNLLKKEEKATKNSRVWVRTLVFGM